MVAGSFGELLEYFSNLLRPRNSILYDQVHKFEEPSRGVWIVADVNFTWMNLVIAYDAHNVQCLLDLYR